MAGQLTQKAREIKQALLDLQSAGMQTTANMQNVMAFLDKLASGQTLSGLDYLTKNLKELSVAMKELGVAGSDVTKATTQIATLAKTTRVLTQETNALRTGMGPQKAGTNWLWRQNMGDFENEQAAYKSYLSRVRELSQIQKAMQERQARRTGQPIPMQQLVDPNLPQVNEEFFRGLGFTADATERLRKRLESIGFSSANVTRNVTEMSTGITQLRFKTEAAGGNMRTFTVTLDRAGNILDDTQKRFRTFGNAIVRDTIEVLKWSIAIGLVYGPMRKMTELLQQAAKIQSSLADVQIALGKSTTQLGSIFEAAAQIANETSSSIEGVIDGYQEAYSAAGSVSNQFERVATANALLRDSMVLSKLAGIDQAQALDTLVGALRQSGRDLYDGQELLDGWVAVAKNANVTLNQLASTFAIVGTAAEDVGITVDQLNAIVGTLAESTKLSADETGNAIRGFISGFQSAKAEETLAKFGIAVRTTSGEVRSFVDLMEELSVLSQAGVLSEREVAEITNVIGGGFRRGAQLAALLENFNRVMSLTEISMGANGDAAEALGIKMNTLESAITRLGNSFSVLGQALGGEGGVLNIFTSLVDVATKAVQAVTSIVNVLKGAAPILAMIGIVGAIGKTGTGLTYLNRNVPTSLAYLFARNFIQQQAAGQAIATPPGKGFLGGVGIQQLGASGNFATPTWLDIGRKINEAVTKGLSKIPLVGGKLSPLGAGGLLVPGALIGSQIAQGELGKAGVTLAGAFGAAFISGGSSWITAAGSIMASAFYDKFIEFEPDFAQRWADLIVEGQREGAPAVPETQEDRQKKIADLEKDVSDSLNLQERVTINTRTFFLNLAQNYKELVNYVHGTDVFPEEKPLQNIDLLTQAFLKQQSGQKVPSWNENFMEWFIFGGQMRPGVLGAPEAGQFIDDNTYNAMQKLMNEFLLKSAEEGLTRTPTQQAIISTQENLANIAASAAEDLITDALKTISEGAKGGVEQYIDASRIQTALSLSASQLIVAVQTAQKAVPGTTLQAPQPARAVGFIAGLTQEESQVLTQLTGEIMSNFERISELTSQGFLSDEDSKALEEYNKNLTEAVSNLERLLPALESATLLREAELKIKPIIDLPDKLTGEQQLDLVQKAEKYWRYVLEKQGLTNEEIDAYINAQQEKLIRADQEILDYKTKAPADIISTVADTLGLGKQNQFQFIDLRDRLGFGQLEQLLLRYQQISTAFKQNIPGFELELDPVTLILKDGFKNMDVDMRLFNLALQELIDIEKEQLVEGMFNLPSGATFYVPFDAAALDARSRASAETTMDMESLFAQYAPDPNAFETSVKEGAMLGIIEGMDKVALSGKQATSAEWWDNLLKERLFKQEDQWQIPEVSKPQEALRPYTPYPYTGPNATGETGFLTPIWKSILGEYTGQQFADVLSTIGDTIGEALIQLLPGMSKEAQPVQPELKSYQREEPLKKGDLTTYMNLQISSTSNVILNEQVIGQAVKQYLEQDMLRYDDTTGSINKVVTL